MNNGLTQTSFDYTVLDEDTRIFVKVKAEAIQSRLKRTAEDIIAIGQDLIEVKSRLGHGEFLPWIKAEFEMSRWTAQNFMNAATKFADKRGNFHHLSSSVIYELAAPSTPETIVQEVLSGEIKATEDQTLLEAVKEAKRAAVDAVKAKRQIEEEYATSQQQLALAQSNARNAQYKLEQEIANLKYKMETMAQPKKEIVYDDKPETKAKLAELEERQLRLKNELQKKERDLEDVRGYNAKFAEENRKLTDRMRQNLEQEESIKERLRIQNQWRRATDLCYSTVTRIIGEIPSPIDQESLDGDDWARHAQCVEVLQRALSALGQMKNSQPDRFVEASIIDDSPNW